MDRRVFLKTSAVGAASRLLPVRAHAAQNDAAKSGPGGRQGHVMCYSEQLKACVLVGGYDEPSRKLEAAWGWNGRAWEPLKFAESPAPEARTLAACAYDDARSRVVLVGGLPLEGDGGYGDVWELSGRGWEKRAATGGPVSLDHHACAYDAARKYVVIYGGQDEQRRFVRATWLWDGRAWKRVEGENPGGRVHHAMAYDTARGRVVLFGGYGEEGRFHPDTWEWDGERWTRASANGPARTHVRMAYDGARRVTVMFGGSTGMTGPGQIKVSDETWLWDGASWRRVEPAARPSARFLHAMAYDSARQRVVLYSGGLHRAESDTWEWDGSNWARV